MGWTTRLLERIKRRRWAPAACLLLGLLTGCANYEANRDSRIARHAGASGGLPEPNGAYTFRILEAQAEKAEASDFVVSLDEWTLDGIELGPHGQRHLAAMARRLTTGPGPVNYPVVLEPGFDANVNETRRQVLVTHLLRNGVADANDRVIIAYPQAEYFYGDQAEYTYWGLIYPNRNRNLNNGLGYGNNGYNGLRGGYGMGGLGGLGTFGGLGGGGGFGLFGF
jgi:hypothetical protein